MRHNHSGLHRTSVGQQGFAQSNLATLKIEYDGVSLAIGKMMVFNQIYVTVQKVRETRHTGAVARALLRMTARTTHPLTLEPQWLKQARSVYFEARLCVSRPCAHRTHLRCQFW